MSTQSDETVVDRVNRDLRRFPLAARRSALAGAALRVAAEVDAGEADPNQLAALSRELRALFADLTRAWPPKSAKDGIDDLAARRAKRLAG